MLREIETIPNDAQDDLLVQDGDLMMIAFLPIQVTSKIKHDNE